jgi:hypothetical protein
MKNFTLIALFLFGLTFASHANTTVEISTPFQTTETSVSDNGSNTTVAQTNSSDESSFDAKKKKKRKKSFRDRSLAGKILIIVGVAVFAVLCLLFGTVSIG